LRRGSLLFAYIKSLLCIVVVPPRAARGLTIPDRWGRCVRWALVHLAVVTLAGVLLADGYEMGGYVVRRILLPTSDLPDMLTYSDPPVDRLLVWSSHSALGWGLPLAAAVGLACLISIAVPGRHRAAKLGGVKWSLYLTPVFPLVMACWYAYYFTFPPVGFASSLVSPPLPETSLLWMVLPYGLWWALGVSAHPYNRRQGWEVVVGYALSYFTAWFLVSRLLFAPGPLEALR
jgi:hypothetical protein